MTNIIQDLVGVDFMTEKDIVTELLLSTKHTLTRYTVALGETATPRVREVLKKHLNQTIDTQGQLMDYAVEKGYCYPFNPAEQFKDDLKEAYTALDLEAWKLQSDEESFGPKREIPIVRS
jgi:similar to spore coat protein